jgi:hypothetical protein
MEREHVLSLLASSGPPEGETSELMAELMLYGQFAGSWSMEGTWYGRDGSSRTGTGEWHFGWVLGGRGIQDVLYATGATPDQYGTSLRAYHPAIRAWHVTWMQPASSEFVNLIGRKAGDRIVQDGHGPEPGQRVRWSFTDITNESFRWIGEFSEDDGATWFFEQEMWGTRMSSPTARDP